MVVGRCEFAGSLPFSSSFRELFLNCFHHEVRFCFEGAPSAGAGSGWPRAACCVVGPADALPDILTITALAADNSRLAKIDSSLAGKDSSRGVVGIRVQIAPSIDGACRNCGFDVAGSTLSRWS